MAKKKHYQARPSIGGITTSGVRNIVRDGKFVTVCNVCKKVVQSITNNMCEDCYNEWFENQGNSKGKRHVG